MLQFQLVLRKDLAAFVEILSYASPKLGSSSSSCSAHCGASESYIGLKYNMALHLLFRDVNGIERTLML